MVATTNVIVALPAVVSGLIEKLTPDWQGVTSRKFLLFIAISAVKKRCMCNGRYGIAETGFPEGKKGLRGTTSPIHQRRTSPLMFLCQEHSTIYRIHYHLTGRCHAKSQRRHEGQVA
ncbi:hypothetical protein [Paraburkholderia sp. SIMBA_030]|uniref:hypothetical protein n=1 Tax=Paraburkholderia sp. SIMBA_030 TaxID=3085773 RepID=UPI003978905B